MDNQFSRTELLLGEKSLEILKKSHIAIFGIGGVGGFVTEALARIGVGNFDLIDNDTICLSNLNRQIIAAHSSLGKYKVDEMKNRILDINPNANVNVFKCFYLPETKNLFDFTNYDYVIDAVDTVTAKIQLILQAKESNTKIISCMGTGNKLDPTKFEITDIERTSVCPLARVMRQECKKRGIKNVKVLFSTEKPLTPKQKLSSQNGNHKIAPGSVPFVPSVAGLIIAGEVVKDLLSII